MWWLKRIKQRLKWFKGIHGGKPFQNSKKLHVTYAMCIWKPFFFFFFFFLFLCVNFKVFVLFFILNFFCRVISSFWWFLEFLNVIFLLPKFVTRSLNAMRFFSFLIKFPCICFYALLCIFCYIWHVWHITKFLLYLKKRKINFHENNFYGKILWKY